MTLPGEVLKSLQISYQMAPAASFPELPNCGISLSRWQRRDGGSSRVIEHHLPSYILSLILQPMRARAWLGSTRIWDGAISQHTIRLTPPGVDPSWQADGAFDFLLFTIPTEVVEKVAGDDSPRAHDLCRLSPLYIRDDVVFQIGRSMLNAFTAQRPFAQQFADGLGSALVAHIVGSYFLDPAIKRLTLSPFVLKRVTQYVQDHLSQEITVVELASVAGLSGSRFAHAFRASTGEPPHSFITTVRVREAQELLRGTKKPISEISVDCGFKDPSHFSRVFRASLGVTPRDFRLYQSGS